jgi:hypothetical protein
MKQKDIALIVTIVIVSAIVSLFVSNQIFASPSSRQQEVEAVQPITSSFPTKANAAYFNGGFDPTQLIQISPNNNSNPFNAAPGQ